MKNLKLFVAFAFSLAVFLLPATSHAQTRTVSTQTVNQGTFIDLGGIYPSGGTVTPIDSLQVSDSIAYLIPMSHTIKVLPYITWYWNKIGAGTATVTETFLQSNDGTNWFAVLKGQAQSAYSKTWTLSANTWNEIDFARDTALFAGRYLKVYYITSATASVKGKIFTRVKTNIQ
jgi:hypothetical protein